MRHGDQDSSRPGGAPTLEFWNVHAEYGSSISLFTDLSMEVTSGTITVLKGRSGSGKSTALAIASGLLAPAAGTVCWGSEDLYQLDEAARTQIRRDHFGIVLQNGGLINSLTALENVLLPVLRRRATTRDRKRALEVLDELGIAHRADHPPARLSGGEIQRVAIARALYKNPQLLLMDEPTASLDRTTATSVIELIQGLRDTNRGLLIASHDQSVIEAADIEIDVEHLDKTRPLAS